MTDPCNCAELCPHGVRCAGSHPGSGHWWTGCDWCAEPPIATVYRLADGRYISVLTGCGHAVITDRAPRREHVEHLRLCEVADTEARGYARAIAAPVIEPDQDEAGLTRLRVNLTAESMAALQQAAEVSGDTLTDTVNRALHIYRLFVVEVLAENRQIKLHGPDGTIEDLWWT